MMAGWALGAALLTLGAAFARWLALGDPAAPWLLAFATGAMLVLARRERALPAPLVSRPAPTETGETGELAELEAAQRALRAAVAEVEQRLAAQEALGGRLSLALGFRPGAARDAREREAQQS